VTKWNGASGTDSAIKTAQVNPDTGQ
ncbi:MAG: hypothetical protein JWQ60_742, partial [Pseudonocardia sp.]|nr:hypothetical protein [Pseudonocardia sp.]